MATEHKVITLNWYQKPYEYLSREEFNTLLDELRADPDLEEIQRTDVRRYCFFDNTFQVIALSKTASEIRVRRDTGEGQEAHRYKYQNSQETAADQNGKMSGGAAYDILDSIFTHRYKISIFKAFTAKEYKELSFRIKRCVPPQIHYAAPSGIEERGYIGDVSSCFPAEASRPLPTLHGSHIVPGRVKPSEDFPFAFYLNSHHIAVYGEFDTREFDNQWYHDYYATQYDDLIDEDLEEETLLCPASEYSFDPVMRKLYNGRKEHAENKDVMNKTIGVFHYNGNPRLAHLSAIIIARSIFKMCIRANWLEAEGNKVYHISTDAILWQGNLSPVVCTDYKDMGKFMLQERDVRFCIRSANCYQFERTDGTVVTKFSGNVPKAERDAMRLGDIWTYDDARIRIKKICRTEDGHFEEVDDDDE